MRKNTKLNRIKKLVKKYPEVSSYLLNIYSRKVYTHADLDIIEELLREGYFNSEFRDGWYDGAIHFYNGQGPTLRGEFYNLQSYEGKWNGLYHFTAIRRALHDIKLSPFFNGGFESSYQFWANDDFEYVIDVDKRLINWWPHDGHPEDLEKFKESIEDVMSSIIFRGSKNEFSYELVENPDELLIGLDIVNNGNNEIVDPYLSWTPEDMTVEKEKGEVAGEPATILYLKRDGVTVSIGVEEGDGKVRLHTSDGEGGSIAELWNRKGYSEIIWDDNVPEIVIEEAVVEDEF